MPTQRRRVVAQALVVPRHLGGRRVVPRGGGGPAGRDRRRGAGAHPLGGFLLAPKFHQRMLARGEDPTGESVRATARSAAALPSPFRPSQFTHYRRGGSGARSSLASASISVAVALAITRSYPSRRFLNASWVAWLWLPACLACAAAAAAAAPCDGRCGWLLCFCVGAGGMPRAESEAHPSLHSLQVASDGGRRGGAVDVVVDWWWGSAELEQSS